MRLIGPRSVLDVGCGNGSWLKAFVSQGVDDFLGLDGPWVKPEHLVIPPDRFRVTDLATTYDVGRTFDLAVSIEVAEHLDKSCAPSFVKLLAKSAPVIAFSAAIPYQGGVRHVNEKWPEYWVELFADEGYRVANVIRPLVWCDINVGPCHAQDVFIYIKGDDLSRSPLLKDAAEQANPRCLSRVHPKIYLGIVGGFVGGNRPRSVSISGYLTSGPVVTVHTSRS